jgi:hypothetical protein
LSPARVSISKRGEVFAKRRGSGQAGLGQRKRRAWISKTTARPKQGRL